jgi:hypothetical protein
LAPAVANKDMPAADRYYGSLPTCERTSNEASGADSLPSIQTFYAIKAASDHLIAA